MLSVPPGIHARYSVRITFKSASGLDYMTVQYVRGWSDAEVVGELADLETMMNHDVQLVLLVRHAAPLKTLDSGVDIILAMHT